MRILDCKSWRYFIQGLTRRLTQVKQCPVCGSSKTTAVDRKFFHTLEQCSGCGILFRFPRDSTAELNEFYQHEYSQPGLTTELPSLQELRALIAAGFKESLKDFSKIILLFNAIGLEPGDRVLDYGANWGYGTWQFIKAGFDATGYEVSKARANFGENLGIHIITDVTRIVGPFDVVYSGHVLEHVGDPAIILSQHLEWTRPDGYVLVHTPNGSRARREAQPQGFRRSWGRVHPVLLTDDFVISQFKEHPFFLSSTDDPNDLGKWDRRSQHIGPVDGPGLFFAIRNSKIMHAL